MLDAAIYLLLLTLWSAVISYILMFRVAPMFFTQSHGGHAPAHAEPVAHPPAPRPIPRHDPQSTGRKSFSAYEGFKSFAQGPELTVDDIVQGISRER